MILPVAILFLATLSAAIVAYGAHPALAQYPHGIEFILLARRLQWPLVALSIVLCVALIGLVVAGRRRSWFLIGLGPVLALFAHHFAPTRNLAVVEDAPTFVSSDEAKFLRDDEFVVGLSFGDAKFAYPYAQLFDRPVILQSDHEKRLILLWSAFANRAVASTIGRTLRGRDLEIVSTPANSLLVYNARLGEFIVGVTGLTSKKEKPSGFDAPIDMSKMTWGEWRRECPATRVLAPLRGGVRTNAPSKPILPAYPMPPMSMSRPALTRVALLGSVHPVAIDSETVSRSPMNVVVENVPVMVFRPSSGEGLRAFDRRLPNDLLPRFRLNETRGRRGGEGIFKDDDTGSSWSAEGAWVDGLKALKGKKLTRVPIEDDLYWGVMKWWYPKLTLETGPEAPAQ